MTAAALLGRMIPWPFTGGRTLRKLASATAAGDSVHHVSSLVHKAIHDRLLKQAPDGSFLPATPMPLRVGDTPGDLVRARLRPLPRQACALPTPQIAALSVIFEELHRSPRLRAVPQWISDGWALSLYLDDAIDLRATDTQDHDDAAACTRSVSRHCGPSPTTMTPSVTRSPAPDVPSRRASRWRRDMPRRYRRPPGS